MATAQRVTRDEPIPSNIKPPEVPKETAEALKSGKQVFLIAPRSLVETTPKTGYPLRRVLESACGSVANCKANVVSSMRWLRLRTGDRIVVAVPHPDYPYELGHVRLSAPISVDDCWDPTGDGNAGAVHPPTFFAAIAQAARPLAVKRREDNGTFELHLA